MLSYKFPVAKIYNVYAKGEMLEGYVVLEEEKIEGEIYYKKDCAPSYLLQVLRLFWKIKISLLIKKSLLFRRNRSIRSKDFCFRGEK